MPFVTPQKTSRFSLGIMGAPNHGKTRSLRTLPTPCCIVSMPGEGGHATLPVGIDGFTVFQWQDTNLNLPDSWATIRNEVKKTLTEILTGKHGPFASLALDGMHKYYGVHANVVSEALYGKDFMKIDFRKVSPPANRAFFGDLALWKQYAPPLFVMTYWVSFKAEDPSDEDSPQHMFPALSGKAGEQIVGECDGTVYAHRQGTGPAARYVWGTQPTPKVWGIGIKGDPAIVDKIPPLIPQDWTILEKHLRGLP